MNGGNGVAADDVQTFLLRTPGWQDQAMEYVRRHVVSLGATPFLAEDIAEAVRYYGLDDPPDRRAWGAVMQRARREGLIEACGYAPARSSNLSPKVLWRRKETALSENDE